ncbi:four helix bundle protein [Hymenobacter sp. BT507]|uniref:Four helix bundle protein n=1 Tax=Hymenobacter citatus TaxID=2763506 RepID=A0ABR7MK90_9BACT|nr:four helix bundle protein [Hymenobacter citatus]MBC6611501.1 four helix bundle protein [Hymenobacter citatus]
MMPERDNLIVQLTFDFALCIIQFTQQLEDKRRFVIANQLLKSGTAIGANVREAQSAESRADFTHKCKVAAKEAEETEYWLLLCHHSVGYGDTNELRAKLLSIRKVLSKIISSSRAV